MYAGQDHVKVGVATTEESALQIQQSRVDFIQRFANPHPHVRADLIISAARGVQLAADVADTIDQSLLDMHVDVFQLDPHRQTVGVEFRLDLSQSVSN